MSMHQIEAFIEEAVRNVATSNLENQRKRDLIFTLFEMETYGDCGFTNLRTINEMAECKYTTLFDAKEMYDFDKHPEYYENEDYSGEDDIYYSKELSKYCVDAGSKAWEKMKEIGKITGEAAKPVKLISFIETLKEVKKIIPEMDKYIKEGFYDILCLTGIIDNINDEDSIEITGMTRDRLEEYLFDGETDEEAEEKGNVNKDKSNGEQKTYSILGCPFLFEADVYLKEDGKIILNGYKSSGILSIYGTKVPFNARIIYKLNEEIVFKGNIYSPLDKQDEEYSNLEKQSEEEKLKYAKSKYEEFSLEAYIAQINEYLLSINKEEYISNVVYGYTIKKGIHNKTNAIPKKIDFDYEISASGIKNDIFIFIEAKDVFSFDFHIGSISEILNESII